MEETPTHTEAQAQVRQPEQGMGSDKACQACKARLAAGRLYTYAPLSEWPPEAARFTVHLLRGAGKVLLVPPRLLPNAVTLTQ